MKFVLMEVLNRVKILLNNAELEESYLKIYCEQAYNEACGVCNVKDMPEESATNIAFLCISNLMTENNNNIQSMSEGGRSVSFGNMTSQQLREKAIEGLSKWKKVRCV